MQKCEKTQSKDGLLYILQLPKPKPNSKQILQVFAVLNALKNEFSFYL